MVLVIIIPRVKRNDLSDNQRIRTSLEGKMELQF